jgi:phage regulator Rha-like protein
MASEKSEVTPVERLHNLIYEIRGMKVMLDVDLAQVYGVTTKALNQAVKRNVERFPADFAFLLTRQEVATLRSQIVTSTNRSQFVTGSQKHRDPRFPPYAFTEHGAIMAANVINSPRAVQMSVFVVRAFLKMRAALSDTRELARKLATLEKDLKDRLNVHDAAIVTILQRIMDIIDPPALPEPQPKKGIGFQVKERRSRYRTSASRNHH